MSRNFGYSLFGIVFTVVVLLFTIVAGSVWLGYGLGKVEGIKVAEANYTVDLDSSSYQRQVKFTPFPDIAKLDTDTIIYIENGWNVIGVTDGYLILEKIPASKNP